MSGALGSAFDMIQKLSQDKKLRRQSGVFHKNKGFLRRKKEDYKATRGRLKSKKASPRLLESIRDRLQRQHLYHRRMGSIITILVFSGIAYWFSQTAFKTEYIEQPIDMATETLKRQDYHFYINEAERWLQEEHWHNAAFQYEKALALFPGDTDVMYNLCWTYAQHCAFEDKHCKDALALLSKLKTTNSKVNVLRNIELLLNPSN